MINSEFFYLTLFAFLGYIQLSFSVENCSYTLPGTKNPKYVICAEICCNYKVKPTSSENACCRDFISSLTKEDNGFKWWYVVAPIGGLIMIAIITTGLICIQIQFTKKNKKFGRLVLYRTPVKPVTALNTQNGYNPNTQQLNPNYPQITPVNSTAAYSIPNNTAYNPIRY